MLLYAHAQKIVDEDKPVAGLFLGTGSTKTRIAIMLARGKALVICPKTQKEDRNWEREVEKIQEVKKDFKIDLTVVSKEEFKKLRKAGWKEKFDTLIGDEAHTCLGVTPTIRYVKKQPVPKTSQIFEELDLFIKEIKPSRLYLLSATIIKSPMTVWGAAKLLGYKWDFYTFRDTFYARLPVPGREIWAPRKDEKTKDRLAEAVKKIGYTGRLQDWFDVPDQMYKTIHVDLTPRQVARIKEAKLEFPDPLVQVGKRHQIENGVLSGDEFNNSESFPNQKMDVLLDLNLEFPRMVIFARYTSQILQIANTFKKEGKKVLVLEGATKNRGQLIRNANLSEECILVVQCTISAGWELPGPTKEEPSFKNYDCMVFASMDYSLVNRIQGEGRILRASGLKKNLYIDIVARGGVDEAVHKAIINKKSFDERIYLKENE